MNGCREMKRLLIWIVAVLVVVEIVYLAAVNVVLNLPGTQAYINQINPTLYQFKWDRAWSLHPFRIHVTGFSANGQSWVQQWQIAAPEVSASIAILPMLDETFYVSDIVSADATFHFRPLVGASAGVADAALRQYFPTIAGRDPDAKVEPAPKEQPGWSIVYDIGSISGENDVWLGATRMTLVGEASGAMRRQNRFGPLTISDGVMDATVKSLSFAGQKVADSGSLDGTFHVGPYLPQESRGFKLLAFLTLDAEIDLPVTNIDFLNVYLTRISGLKLGGNGLVKGKVAFDKGDLSPGTDLSIASDDLSVELDPYAVKGDGTVVVKVAETTPDTMDAAVTFKTLTATHNDATLVTGTDLSVAVARTAHIQPGDRIEKVPHKITVTIPEVTVPDVSAYATYIPEKWNLRLLSGSGSLQGSAEFAEKTLDFDLTLKSDQAEMQFEKDSFETGLEMVLKAKGTSDDTTAKVDITGTYLDLDDSQVKTKSGDDSDPWQTSLTVTEGEADFDLPAGTDADVAAGFVGFWSLFHDKELKALLTTADAKLKASLTVSDLDWIDLLFKNPYSLVIHDSAEVLADLTVTDGDIAEGSSVEMPTTDFTLEVLDYVAAGTGGFDVAVTKGGDTPDLKLTANLTDASLRLQDEKAAVVEQVTLALTAISEGVTLKDGGTVKSAELDISSAKVTDMSAYNDYLPKSAPVRLLGGAADLTAKLTMQPEAANGFVKLKTSRITADVDGDRVSGVIGVDIKIVGGSAEKKNFVIGGSSIQLSGLRAAGATSGNWNARIDISKGKVVWQRPMNLDVTTSFSMTDVSPLLAILEEQRRKHKWIDRVFDLKDVRGNATLEVAPKDVVVSYALAKADKTEVGAKGIFQQNNRQGMYYLKYGNLSGILEFDGDKKRFGLFGATKKFQDYVPGGRLPGLSKPRRSSQKSSGEKAPFHIFRRR